VSKSSLLSRRRTRDTERRSLGLAIRRARKAQGRTLVDVAKAAEVSVSLLSQVERGLTDPSLDSLRDIAWALGTTPFQLLADGSAPRHIVRRGTGLKLSLPLSDGEYELLSPSLGGAFEVGTSTLEAGRSSPQKPQGHPGEEAALILNGTIQLELDEEVVELREGDFIAFDARAPHRITAVGDGSACMLFILSPPSSE
jgi:quercetin dioxygenase-like cupin family protein/DNA-binding XRE family transcriptional regulator